MCYSQNFFNENIDIEVVKLPKESFKIDYFLYIIDQTNYTKQSPNSKPNYSSAEALNSKFKLTIKMADLAKAYL